MQEENIKIGEMKKRRVMMADDKRYLIYYTFDLGFGISDFGLDSLPTTNPQSAIPNPKSNGECENV